MNIENLTPEQYNQLNEYLDENKLLLEQIEDDIYNEEEVLEYIKTIYMEEREYFIREVRKHNICGDLFIDVVVRDEDSMDKNCVDNLLYEKEIEHYFDMIYEGVYVVIQ